VRGNEKRKKTKTKKQNKTKKTNPKRKIFSFFWKHKRQLSIIRGKDGDDSGDRIQFSMNCNNRAKIKTQVFFSILLLQFAGLS